ncbi:MAG: iron-containing alcohol dehydrogenase [Syntrophobacteraceae bacterium]
MKCADVEFEPFFTWMNRPRIMYSPGVRRELAFEMAQLGGSNVLIVTDKGLVQAGVAEMVAEEVRKSDLELVGVFDNIVQDARLDNINEGAAFYRSRGADCLVVVGGGSVMDTAKSINIMIGEGVDDFRPLAEQAGLWEGAKPLPPHIVFPTTAGTGSEVTNAIVVLDVEARAKLAITHPFNADLAMLDPELTVSLPPKVTAFTGMDALTHAVEGVTSTGAEPITDALGLHAIRLIFRYLPEAVMEPHNVTARGHMLIASTLAGMCFNNAQLGGTHATAHALGAHYGIPHGLANAIMLPLIMEHNVEECPVRFMMVADAMGMDVSGKDPLGAARMAVQAVKDLKARIGLTQTLKDFGLADDRERLMPTVELAASDSQVSYNPRYLEEEDIFNLYIKAL